MPTSTSPLLPDNLHNFIDVNLPLVFVLTLVFAIVIPVIVAWYVVRRAERRAEYKDALELRGRMEGLFLNRQHRETIFRHVGDAIGRSITTAETEQLRQEMMDYCASVDPERRIEMRALARAEFLEHLLPDMVDAARGFVEEERED